MLIDGINGLIATAMKEKDGLRLNTLREIKTELTKVKTSGVQYTEALETDTLVKMVKRYKEAIKEFKEAANGNSDDIIAQYENELCILKEFAPKEATDDDIANKVKEIVSTLTSPSMKDMKTVQSEVKAVYPSADGGLISKIFRSLI